MYSYVLDHYDREVSPPWTMEKAVMALAALGEGFSLQRVFDDDVSGREVASEAFAAAVVAIAMTATRPRS